MTEAQVNSKFPVLNFKQARELSSLNHSHHAHLAVELELQDELVKEEKENGNVAVPKADNAAGKAADEPKTSPKRTLALNNLLGPFTSSPRTNNAGDLGEGPLAFEMASNLEAQTNTLSRVQEDHDDEEDDDDEKLDDVPHSFIHSDNEGSLDTCAVCIDTLEDEDQVRLLACGHIFHAECIDPWLLTRQACCPLCKVSFYDPKPSDPLGPDPVEVIEAQYQQALRDGDGIAMVGSVTRLSRRWFGGASSVNVPGVVVTPEVPAEVPGSTTISESVGTASTVSLSIPDADIASVAVTAAATDNTESTDNTATTDNTTTTENTITTDNLTTTDDTTHAAQETQQSIDTNSSNVTTTSATSTSNAIPTSTGT